MSSLPVPASGRAEQGQHLADQPPDVSIETDIQIFRMAAELLGVTSKRDRRKYQRHEFNQLILIGPYPPAASEDDELLLPVRCHDLSQGGISFFLPGTLSGRVLVTLNSSGSLRLVAEPVHQVPVDESKFVHLISCRFVCRA